MYLAQTLNMKPQANVVSVDRRPLIWQVGHYQIFQRELARRPHK